MRTNYDLVREILIDIADADLDTDLSNYNICQGKDPKIIGWHIKKLIDAGYLDGIDASDKLHPYDFICIELTPEGEKFLNKIENTNRWAKIKAYIKDNSIDISFKAIEFTYKFISGF